MAFEHLDISQIKLNPSDWNRFTTADVAMLDNLMGFTYNRPLLLINVYS